MILWDQQGIGVVVRALGGPAARSCARLAPPRASQPPHGGGSRHHGGCHGGGETMDGGRAHRTHHSLAGGACRPGSPCLTPDHVLLPPLPRRCCRLFTSNPSSLSNEGSMGYDGEESPLSGRGPLAPSSPAKTAPPCRVQDPPSLVATPLLPPQLPQASWGSGRAARRPSPPPRRLSSLPLGGGQRGPAGDQPSPRPPADGAAGRGCGQITPVQVLPPPPNSEMGPRPRLQMRGPPWAQRAGWPLEGPPGAPL